VTVIRRQHLQWRTEQAYRGWARRFASWLGERRVEDTCPDDIRGFLDHLAVEGKVSASTQRQALNALVFLLREALEPRSRRFFRLPSRPSEQTDTGGAQPAGMSVFLFDARK